MFSGRHTALHSASAVAQFGSQASAALPIPTPPMNHEIDLAELDPHLDAHQKRASAASDAILRRWVTWFGVFGTLVLGAFFFGFMVYQALWGSSEPANWLVKLSLSNYPALVGTPMSAVTAFFIVSMLKVTNGSIEFEALGFKFRGASGPIILWILCFLAIVAAFRLLWPMTAIHAPPKTAPDVTALASAAVTPGRAREPADSAVYLYS